MLTVARQEHHGGRVWWMVVVYFMAGGIQGEKAREKGAVDKMACSVTYFLQLGPPPNSTLSDELLNGWIH